MAGVFELYATINLDNSSYKAELKEASNATAGTAKSIGADTVAVGVLAAQMAAKVGEAFVSMAKKGIEYNAKMETYTVALTTALGNEAAAVSTIEKIKEDAAKTPYSVEGLVQANRYLISTGESAESARATILALTDAVSATGGGNDELQRMALNLQQIKNVGKATAMDIRQFAMAGIDIYGILADYTGKTTTEVKELDVTYDLLSAALQKASAEGGRFYEANLKQSQTLNGQWSTLKDNVSQKLGEAFLSLSNTISDTVLPATIKFVQNLDVEKAVRDLKNAGLTIAALVGPFIAVEGAAKAATAATKLFNSILAAGPWTIAAAGLLTVAAAVKTNMDAFDEWVEEQTNVGETAEEVSAHLDEMRAHLAALEEQAAGGMTDSMLYDEMLQYRVAIADTEQRLEELTAAEASAANEADGMADSTESAGEALGAMTENAEMTTTALSDIIESYNKLHDQVSKKVKGWFGLFDQAKVNVKTSVSEMMSAMQSQIAFNTNYSANLEYLAANGLSALGSAFQSMGAEGSVYAETIVQAIEDAGGASSEGGQKIIQDFQAMAAGVESSQGELSDSLTNLTGSLEEAFSEWGATAEQAAEALNVSGAAGSAAAASVNAYIAGILGGSRRAEQAAGSVARAAARGFASVSGGVGVGGVGHAVLDVGSDYIPYDNYPALLHKGEMVVPAKISEDLRDFIRDGSQPAVSAGGNNGEIVSLLRELISATRRPIVLDDGTLVGHTATAMDMALGTVDELRERGLCLA